MLIKMPRSAAQVNWAFISAYFVYTILLLISLGGADWTAANYLTIALVFFVIGLAIVLNEYENPAEQWGFWLLFYTATAAIGAILLLTVLFSALYHFSVREISLALALIFTVGATYDLIVIQSSVLIFWAIAGLTLVLYVLTLAAMIEDKKSDQYWEWIVFALAIVALLVAFFVKREYPPGRLTRQQRKEDKVLREEILLQALATAN